MKERWIYAFTALYVAVECACQDLRQLLNFIMRIRFVQRRFTRSAFVQCALTGRICALSICRGGYTCARQDLHKQYAPSSTNSFFKIPLVLRHHPCCAHSATAPQLRLPSRIEHGSAQCARRLQNEIITYLVGSCKYAFPPQGGC